MITTLVLSDCSFALRLDESSIISRGESEAVPDTVQKMLQYALKFEGAPYSRGGDGPVTGFDCSGFVQYVFDRTEGIRLPHSASEMSQIGNRVQISGLLPGDLVFFAQAHQGVSHVGIYIGQDQFIHASSTLTGSVVVSSLNENYWERRFVTARRLAQWTENEQVSGSQVNSSLISLRLADRLHNISRN